MRTILLKVLAAAVQHTWHLPVDGVQAQSLVLLLLLLAGRPGRQRELQRLQQT